MSDETKRDLFDDLHAVVLPVGDMTRARRFYEGLLGLLPVRVFENGVLTVYPVGDSTHLCLYPRSEGTEAGTGPAAYANWRVDDLEVVHARLVERGIECTDIGGDETLRLFRFEDPDGNRHDVCSFGREWAKSIGMPVTASDELAGLPEDREVVATLPSHVEAQAAQAHLEHADIPAWIADHTNSAVDALIGDAAGGIVVMVARVDAERAREIIADLERSAAIDHASGGDDDCMQCGQPIPGDADACPACGWTWSA